MSLLDIRSALQNHLSAMPDNLSATAYENDAEIPTSGTPYQTIKLIPASPVNPSYGDNYYREEGIFRVRLYYPTHLGPGPATLQAQKIQSWFHRGRTLISGSSTVIIQRTPSISDGTAIQDRYIIVVDIRYFSNVLP